MHAINGLKISHIWNFVISGHTVITHSQDFWECKCGAFSLDILKDRYAA